MDLINKQHYFLSCSTHIDEIFKPLKQFGILYFTYLRNFFDGSQIYLSNQPIWIESYYKLNLFQNSAYEHNPAKYDIGFSFWSSQDDFKVIDYGREILNSDYGITFTNKLSDGAEFYFFSGAANNPNIVNFYANNLDMLRHFIFYFQERASVILRRAAQNKIIIPNHFSSDTAIEFTNTNFPFNHKKNLVKSRQEFFSQTSLMRLHLKENISETKLTGRELDVANYLLLGKTADETANLFQISRRTVETYIEQLKSKFNCRTKTALLKKLINDIVYCSPNS